MYILYTIYLLIINSKRAPVVILHFQPCLVWIFKACLCYTLRHSIPYGTTMWQPRISYPWFFFREKPMTSLKRSRKQAIVLLELLIAFSLFCLCVIPLAGTPLKALAGGIKSCQRMHLQRLADLCFADVEAQLFQNAIPWKELTATHKNKTELFHDIQTIELKGMGKRQFERTCTIWTSRRKEGKNQEQYRLLTVELCFKSLNDRKFFFAKKEFSDKTVFRHLLFVAQCPATPQAATVPMLSKVPD